MEKCLPTIINVHAVSDCFKNKNVFIGKSGSGRSQSPNKDNFLDLIKILGKIGKIGDWHSVKGWLAQGSSEFATADLAV